MRGGILWKPYSSRKLLLLLKAVRRVSECAARMVLWAFTTRSPHLITTSEQLSLL